MARTYDPMPDQVLQSLEEWHRQALAQEEAGLPIDPDYRLLLPQWTEWPRGILTEPSPVADGLLSFSFRKPNSEETTERQLPAIWLFLTRLHCIAGGRVVIEVHSSSGNNHYPRCYLPGHRPDGGKRRFYVLRQMNGTPPGFVSVEPSPNFHAYDPANLGTIRKQPPGSTRAFIGRDEDIQYTVDVIREAEAQGKRLPATEERVRQMLQDGYRLLTRMLARGEAQAA